MTADKPMLICPVSKPTKLLISIGKSLYIANISLHFSYKTLTAYVTTSSLLYRYNNGIFNSFSISLIALLIVGCAIYKDLEAFVIPCWFTTSTKYFICLISICVLLYT